MIGAARTLLRSPRLVPVIVALTAVLLAVGWLVPGAPGIGPAPAAAALDIRRDGDHYVVMFRDLYAAPASYQRELRQRGLDVDVRLVPTAAASAGRVVDFDGTRDLSAIKPIKAPGECVRLFGCPIGFRIPVGFRGHATVLVGRPAWPGERYGLLEAVDMESRPFQAVRPRRLVRPRGGHGRRRTGAPARRPHSEPPAAPRRRLLRRTPVKPRRL